MKCPICLTEMKDGQCPGCGYKESTISKLEFCEEKTRFGPAVPYSDQPQPQEAAHTGNIPVEECAQPGKMKLAVLVFALLMVIMFILLGMMTQQANEEIPELLSKVPVEEVVEEEPLPVVGEVFGPQNTILQTASWEKQVLYEQDGLKIEFVFCSYSMAQSSVGGYGRFGIGLYLSYTGDGYYAVGFDQIQMNGVSVAGDQVAYVYSGDAFYLELPVDAEQLLRSHITRPEDISFKMIIAFGDPTEDASALSFVSQKRVEIDAADKQGYELPQPEGVLVWQNEEGVSVYCAGGQLGINESGTDQAAFWFWLENKSEQPVQLGNFHMLLDERNMTDIFDLNQVVQPGSCGLIAVWVNSSVLKTWAETFNDLGALQLTFDLEDSHHEPLQEDQQFTVLLQNGKVTP